MPSALVIGGTRFIGRHTVADLLENGYSVTLLNRGNHENPFADDDRVEHVAGDRREDTSLERAAEAASPDVVVDCIAMYPADVETAVDVFADVDAYVYVSSIGAYDHGHVLKYEDETPLVPCSADEATDDSFETYGARKAEGDRVARAAAESGVPATSVRPTMVYGPHNYLGFLQYWIDRVRNEERVLVPGDGSYLAHRTYVEDVASAIRIVAERGEPGEAYNVGDRRPLTIGGTIELIGCVAGRDVEPVYASDRELERGGLSRHAFPLYMGEPFVASTEKLSALGWESTPLEEAMELAVEYYEAGGLVEPEAGPAPEDERAVIDSLG